MSASERTTRDAAGTEALGAELAASLRPGDVVLLRGEVGAGKTTFARGLLRALGVTDRVTSPTFTLARRYVAADGTGLSHLDLHRLADLAAEEDGLLADELGPDRITLVEWPAVAEPELEAAAGRIAARVTLEHAGADERTVTIA